MSETETAPQKRGRKPKPPGEGYRDRRKNVSLDAYAAQALGTVAEKLEPVFGFRPTLTQTVMWLVKNHTVTPIGKEPTP